MSGGFRGAFEAAILSTSRPVPALNLKRDFYNMNERRNLFCFLPAVLWLAMIFFLSSQTGDDTASLSLAITRWLMRFLPSVSESGLHLWLRKLAHVGVYFVEGALLYHALRAWLRSVGKGFFLTIAICALVAAADEAHKVLIPGRHCSWGEAALNVLGAFLGAGLLAAFGKWRKSRRRAVKKEK